MAFSVTSTIVSAAANYDLTDLETAKTELSIGDANTSDDAWLSRAVSQVSRSIATYTKRVFVPEVVQDLFDVSASNHSSRVSDVVEIELSRYPALRIVSVVQSLGNGTSRTLAEGVDFRVDFESGGLTRLDASTGFIMPWERFPVAVIFMAGFGEAITEAHQVPATPFQVTVSGSASFSCDQSVISAPSTVFTRVTGSPAAGQYSVANGVYTFNVADASKNLTFNYGTKDIPDDLVEICLRLTTARFRSKDRDPSLVQQETPGIGMQRWWFGGAPGQSGPFPPDIEGALETYCAQVFG